MAAESRVPTSEIPRTATAGWSLETTIDYLLAVMNEKHEHILTLINVNDRRYEERFTAQDKAVTKAELATEKRFESVNEFRGTLDNQQRTLIPRSEVQVMREGLEDKIGNLQKMLDAFQSRQRERAAEGAGMKGGWGIAVGVVGFVLTLMSLILLILRFFAAP